MKTKIITTLVILGIPIIAYFLLKSLPGSDTQIPELPQPKTFEEEIDPLKEIIEPEKQKEETKKETKTESKTPTTSKKTEPKSETPPELQPEPQPQPELPWIELGEPYPFQETKSPIKTTGIARCYEHTLYIKVKDASGNILADGFLTTDTFDHFHDMIDYTPVNKDQIGSMELYTISMKDGSIDHLHIVSIKLLKQ